MVFFALEAFRIADGIKGLGLWINDLAFFAFAGFTTFCFLLVRSNGEVRGYIIIGILIGFWLFKKLFSRLYKKILVWLIELVRGTISRVFATARGIFLKMYRKTRKSLKKVKNYKKKGLKMQE